MRDTSLAMHIKMQEIYINELKPGDVIDMYFAMGTIVSIIHHETHPKYGEHIEYFWDSGDDSGSAICQTYLPGSNSKWRQVSIIDRACLR